MGLHRASTFIAIAAVFARANGDVGGVCGEDETVALAALETHLEATNGDDQPGARECARAFFARACERHGFGSTDRPFSNDSEATRACFAPVCQVCSRGRLSAVAPRGGSWEKDAATETAQFSARAARRAACSACGPHIPSYDISETARIATMDVWTTGWYASWLAFLAVDAIVAASLGYRPIPGFPAAGINASSHPVLPPVIVDNVAVDPYWSCLLYTSPSPRDGLLSRMPSSA